MKIKGTKFIIKLTEKEDLENIQMLWNNGEVMKWVGLPSGCNITIDKLENWFKGVQKSKDNKHFVVIHEELGFCGEVYYGMKPEYKRAGLDIKFLPGSQGKGLATEALQLLINYIFENEKEIDSVWTEPSIANNSARKLYQRCGLKSAKRPKDMEPEESYWELNREEWETKNKPCIK